MPCGIQQQHGATESFRVALAGDEAVTQAANVEGHGLVVPEIGFPRRWRRRKIVVHAIVTGHNRHIAHGVTIRPGGGRFRKLGISRPSSSAPFRGSTLSPVSGSCGKVAFFAAARWSGSIWLWCSSPSCCPSLGRSCFVKSSCSSIPCELELFAAISPVSGSCGKVAFFAAARSRSSICFFCSLPSCGPSLGISSFVKSSCSSIPRELELFASSRAAANLCSLLALPWLHLIACLMAAIVGGLLVWVRARTRSSSLSQRDGSTGTPPLAMIL